MATGGLASYGLLSCVSVVTNDYDSLSRLIRRQLNQDTPNHYHYDGSNRVAEYLSDEAPTRTYTWGLDLSGTIQGAGGVGGLLATRHGSTSYFPFYDGNGNVSQYMNAAGGQSAHFKYDPFGTLTRRTGWITFTYRFSTKPRDVTTGLYYYGYRYLDPVTGRWPSRDPIEEEGGLNLYGFVGNEPIWHIDVLGLQIRRPCPFEVVGGHSGNPNRPCNVDHREREFNRNKDMCYSGRFYGASCGRTGVGSNLAWPTEAAKQSSLDGTHRNYPNAADPDDLTIGQLLAKRIKEAERDATGECNDSEKCCSRIELKVTCLPDPVMNNARDNDPLANRACNYSNTFVCPNRRGQGGGWKRPLFDKKN